MFWLEGGDKLVFRPLCKFKLHPKYTVELWKPNTFEMLYLYSVPCGEKDCGAWVFIDTSTAPHWGP